MNEKIAKKIKVQATDDMKFYRFVHFKELTLTEYRALKEGEIIEITKALQRTYSQRVSSIKKRANNRNY